MAVSTVTKYSGGAYGKLDRAAGLERHHLPADSISQISRMRGPAIQMDAADHTLTSSYGNSIRAQAYREEIGVLLEQGRFRDAMAHEMRDVRRIAGAKYNEALREMLDYARSAGYLNK